jgi:hypothetical protein
MPFQGNFNTVCLPAPTAKPNVLVNKPHRVLNSVENRFNFELDDGSPFGGVVCLFQPQTSPTDGDPLPPQFSSHLSRASCGARPVRFSLASPTFPLLPREITHKFCYRAIILLLVLGGGGGYYGHSRWGYGGGAGIGLGSVLMILLVAYLLGAFR